MVKYEQIKNNEEYISLVGLGYVGMPIAIEFAKRGMMNNEILETLRKMESPLIDIYVSYMIMEEMKNNE